MERINLTDEDEYFNARIPWVRPQVSHEERKLIYRKSNLQAFCYFFSRILFHACVIALTLNAFKSGNVILAIFGLALNGVLFSFTGWAGISHELFHKSVFTNQKLNSFMSVAFSSITWNNYFYFSFSHYLHHRFALWDRDPESPKEFKPSKFDIFWQLTIDIPLLARRIRILFQNSFGHIPGLVGQELSSLGDKGQTLKVRIKWGARAVLALHLSLLVFSYLSGLMYLSLIFSLGPYTFTLIARSLETVQHHGKLRNVNDFRANTRTVKINPLLGLLYANMNYHVEHHIFPALPFYRIKQANKLLHKKSFFESEEPKGLIGVFRYLFGSKLISKY
jgi:fatty acid desaturase